MSNPVIYLALAAWAPFCYCREMWWLYTSMATLIAASGWFYLFSSQAAHRLAGVEDPIANRLRIRLRRCNGVAMFLLGIAIFAGTNGVDSARQPSAFVAIWVGVMALILIVVALAMADVRLTMRLRRRKMPPK